MALYKTNFFVLATALLVACTSTPEPRPSSNYTSSFISVAESGFKLEVGDTLAWRAPAEVIAKPENDLSPETLNHLKQRFESNVSALGLVLSTKESAKYHIDAVIIVDELLSQDQLVEHFDIAPSLYNSAEYDAGTLVLRVIHPVSERTLWRGAMEIFTDPDMTAKQRILRIDQAVDSFSRNLAP